MVSKGQNSGKNVTTNNKLKKQPTKIVIKLLSKIDLSSRVRRCRLIPLTEPYVRTSYTAHANFHSV
ncbi:hypothetical protein B6N13_17060 [Marinomonas sp. UCMA 3892]|nr:hypothetical protein [Marinomonas sp. UCMA 3892]